LREKYGRRKLGTNMDRYKEEEIELDSDGMSFLDCRSSLHVLCPCTGEPIVEPEVDLSSFLEKQRISDDVGPSSHLAREKEDEEDDISAYLDSLRSRTTSSSKKGKTQHIEWDDELEELDREKKAAEAARGRFLSYRQLDRSAPFFCRSEGTVQGKVGETANQTDRFFIFCATTSRSVTTLFFLLTPDV
jgi:hypothetical protein